MKFSSEIFNENEYEILYIPNINQKKSMKNLNWKLNNKFGGFEFVKFYYLAKQNINRTFFGWFIELNFINTN